MIDFDTKFPKQATNAAWQKAKSFKDKTNKAVKTTGLGPLLVTAEKAWNAVPWKQLDFRTAKSKTMEEAKANLARAKTVQSKEVRAAIAALNAAAKKAESTKKNKLLSSSAMEAASLIETKLNLSKSYLEKLKFDDLAGEITRLEEKEQGSNTLKEIELHRPGGGHIGDALKGQRNDDGSVVLADITWELPTGQQPKALKKQKLNVRAKRLDGSLYTNDMTLTELSSDGKKAQLK